MSTKELHNQTLVTAVESNHRVAIGYPGQEAADNILASNFFKYFLKHGTGESVVAGDNTITLSSSFADATYSIFIRTTNGVGYTIESKAAGSFVVNFLDSDTIDYLCIKL